MANRIKISTGYMEECGAKLGNSAGECQRSVSMLNIHMSSFLSRYQTCSAVPRLEYAYVRNGSLASTLISYKNALRIYSAKMRDMKDRVNRSAELLETTERLLMLCMVLPYSDDMPMPPVPFWSPSAPWGLGIGGIGEYGTDKGMIPPFMPDGRLPDLGAMYEKLKKTIVDKTSVAGGAAVAGALATYGFTNEYGGGECTIGAYSGSASYNAGLFQKDSDGNLIFNPNLKAQIGGTYTALKASASQSVEAMPGVQAGISGEITVMKVEAQTGLSVGVFDENGNLNPSAKLDANAQITVVDASVTGNVDVAGVNVIGEVGVFVGVGAHANIGYENGVVSFDTGIGVGVGVNASISIDISGVVDTITGACEMVSDLADGIENMLGNLFG